MGIATDARSASQVNAEFEDIAASRETTGVVIYRNQKPGSENRWFNAGMQFDALQGPRTI
jgi:hypothetical protein